MIPGFGGTVIRPDQPGYDSAPDNVFQLNQNIEPAAAPA